MVNDIKERIRQTQHIHVENARNYLEVAKGQADGWKALAVVAADRIEEMEVEIAALQRALDKSNGWLKVVHHQIGPLAYSRGYMKIELRRNAREIMQQVKLYLDGEK